MSKISGLLASMLILSEISAALSENLVNINDINSVYSYFDQITSKAIENYGIDSRLNEEVNTKTLNIIFDDKTRVFDELTNISMNLNYYHANKDWTRFMRLMGSYEYQKIGTVDAYDLFSLESQLSDLRKRIKAAINAFKFVGRLDEFDSADYFCNRVYPVANFFLEPLHREALARKYSDLIKMIRHQVVVIKRNNARRFKKMAAVLKTVVKDYFHLIMMTHIKLVALKFFNSLTEHRCRNEGRRVTGIYPSYWPRFALEETQQMTAETSKTLESFHSLANDYEEEENPKAKHIELKRWLQKTIVNESSLSSTGSCRHDCNPEMISEEGISGDECQEYRDCQYIAGDIEICELKGKVRRYLWFKDSNAVYGNNKTCNGIIRTLSESKSKDDDSCGHCICTCVSKPSKSPSVLATISFRDQVSDIADDMVVTGLRFVEKDFMLHVQIMESQLLMDGRTQLSRWKPMERFDFDQNTQMFYVEKEASWLVPLAAEAGYGHPEIMKLGPVVAPAGCVITGVRFRLADPIGESALKRDSIELQIRVTPIDSLRSELFDLNQTHWISPQSQPSRNEVLDSPDFVEFEPSDLRNDAGQSTVPFLDGRSVQSEGFLPVKGVELQFRSGESLRFRLMEALIN